MMNVETVKELATIQDFYLSEDTKLTLSDQAEDMSDTIAEILSIIEKKGLNVLEARELLRDTEKVMYLGAHL